MELVKGRDFAATCVRFQLIAQNDILDKPEYMVRFFKETESTWTVTYTPMTGGWPIHLCIVLTPAPIDLSDPFLKEVLETQFPNESYIRKICVFQVDSNFKIVNKQWVEKTGNTSSI